MEPQPETGSRRWQRDRVIIALLVIAAIVPFIRTLAFGYVMDEIPAIRSNPIIQGWESLVDVWRYGYGSPDQPFEGLYRPLTMFMFAFVWNLTGGWPIWFHALAIVLHTLATILIWRLLIVGGVGRIPSALAAAWFAVHPLHVEAVANVANNSEILVAIWGVTLALFLLRIRDRGASPGLRDAVIAGLLCLAAVLSKESGAMASVLALVCIFGWRREHSTSPRAPLRWVSWIPIVAAFAVAATLVVIARAAVLGGPVTGESIAVPGIDGILAGQRILSMLSLTPKVLGLLLWTPELNPAYGPSEFDQASIWLSALVLVALIALLVAAIRLARRGDRRMLVSLAWVFIAFLPASNLLVPTGQILAERTLYVPSIGVAMILGLVLERAWHLAAARGMPLIARGAVTAMALVIMIGAARTMRWTEVWRSHESVHAQIIAADSANYRGYWYTAVYLGNNGQMEAAFPLIERAFRMYPADRDVRLDYADALLRRGDAARARAVAAPLMAFDEYRARQRAVGVYLDALGRSRGVDSVIVAARMLMTSSPSGAAALYLGIAHEVRGERSLATDAYRDGLRLAPSDSVLLQRLAALQRAP
ncbi:MAG TPA: tetratricopeptide repeat protein [Gemmatimonadaceae bacterium]|nr:tetratricopeptide repeat protein [Gemmatimonadaceae bacterium]